jgi:Protein of unknown function (DUF3515)
VRAPGSSPARRAALIASAIAVPITVLLAFVLTAGHSSTSTAKPLPAVTIVAPPTPTDAVTAACTKVFEKLPVQLGTLNPRKTDSDSSFVAAWGNPAIVIRCGVARPPAAAFSSGAQTLGIDDVLWLPQPQKSQVVYTTIDRSVSIEVTVPANQDQPLSLLAPAVDALPAICTGQDAAGNATKGLPICTSG